MERPNLIRSALDQSAGLPLADRAERSVARQEVMKLYPYQEKAVADYTEWLNRTGHAIPVDILALGRVAGFLPDAPVQEQSRRGPSR